MHAIWVSFPPNSTLFTRFVRIFDTSTRHRVPAGAQSLATNPNSFGDTITGHMNPIDGKKNN